MRTRIFRLFLAVSGLSLATMGLILFWSWRFQTLAVGAQHRWETHMRNLTDTVELISQARSHVFDTRLKPLDKNRELTSDLSITDAQLNDLGSALSQQGTPSDAIIGRLQATYEALRRAQYIATTKEESDEHIAQALEQLEQCLVKLELELGHAQTMSLEMQYEGSDSARVAKIVVEALSAFTLLLLVLYGKRQHELMREQEEEAQRLYDELRREREQLESKISERTGHLEVEIRERTRVEAYNRYRNQVLEKVLNAQPLTEVLQFVAEVFEAQVPGTSCSVSMQAGQGPEWQLPKHKHKLPILCFETTVGFFLINGGDDRAWNYREAADFAMTMGALATEHDQLRSQLSFRADHDLLTGLPNRGLGMQRLSDAVERVHQFGQMCALLSLDLDKFKEVNDSYGHAAGDDLLIEVANMLKTRLRSCDTVARVGGDEFMIVLERIGSPDAAESVARTLLKMFEQPFIIHERPIIVGASIGIAMCMGRGKSAFELCRDADDAMYLAKSRGRHQYQLHTAEISRNSEWRHKIADKLRRALAKNRFRLLYQGQYTMTGTLVGVEALLRLADPGDENISPLDFLRIAEEFGLIHQVGDWVLREVFKQIRIWNETGGPRVPVAVNVSRTQFSRAEFVPSIAALIADYKIDPSLLELEITENAVMHDIRESARQISALKSMGLSVAIDDFGTGYSSLSSLHELPVDKLKLDRAFVQNMQAEGGTLPIVEAALYLARSFRMKMIAEGVETSDQLALLDGLGCEFVQGYLLGRPMPPEKISNVAIASRSAGQ